MHDDGVVGSVLRGYWRGSGFAGRFSPPSLDSSRRRCRDARGSRPRMDGCRYQPANRDRKGGLYLLAARRSVFPGRIRCSRCRHADETPVLGRGPWSSHTCPTAEPSTTMKRPCSQSSDRRVLRTARTPLRASTLQTSWLKRTRALKSRHRIKRIQPPTRARLRAQKRAR